MTRQPCILFFAPLCYPPAGAESIVTAKLVLAMVEMGLEVDIITQGDYGHLYPTRDDGIWVPVKERVFSIDGFRSGGLIARLSGTRLFSFLWRIRSILWSLKASIKAFGLIRCKHYNIIISRASPQYGHLPALITSFWSSIPWCAAWSDPMPPHKAPAPYGEGPDSKAGYLSLKYCELIVKRADWHVFPCERLRNYATRYLPGLLGKSSVIPHISMNNLFHPESIDYVHRNFIICYAGSLTLRDPTIFLKGVRHFLDRHPSEDNFEIVIVGSDLETLLTKSSELNIDKTLRILTVKSYQETLEIMAGATVLLIIEASCDEGIFFPSKFVDFIQTGRPILAVSPRNGTLFDILSEHGGGLAVDCTSADDVARGITDLYTAWKTGELEKRYNSSRLKNLFCAETILTAYTAVIEKLVRH